jgi:uncharacterized protein YacL
MTLPIVRGLFVLSALIMGMIWAHFVATEIMSPIPDTIWPIVALGGVAGGILASIILLGLNLITQEVFERLSPAIVAIILGIVTGGGLSWYVIFWLEIEDSNVAVFIAATFILLFGFVGIFLGLTRASSWEELVRRVDRQTKAVRQAPKLIDTSVLIDGRIADLAETGFLEGTLLIPRFVLHELQRIADSPDDMRRARGRRGLDIVKALQEEESLVDLEIIEDDPEDVREVDAKLVRLARVFDAKVMTNDFNLNKVAQIEGVKVLNINDLANALKPAVMPDEQMKLRIVKEGKEAQQGVGYLDDGTMVVVDGGKEHVGMDVSVLVTSVLQTAAGRMIFSKLQQVHS